MSKYRISDFCHFVDVAPGLKALYNSLTLGVLFVDSSVCEIFSKASGKIFDAEYVPLDLLQAMEERRLIFPVGRRDDLSDYQKMHGLLRDNGIAILYLLVADGCNLACRYCYIENSIPADYQFSLMSKGVCDRAMDLFSKNIGETVSEPKVIIYGGEPLLNKPIVCHAINQFAEYKAKGKLPAQASLVLNTNATLIDNEFISGIADKDIQLAVSLDGNELMHNRMRGYKNGAGTYSDVIKNCVKLKEAGVNFGFSITINKENIHHLEDVMLGIHKEFGMDSIGFNIAINQSYEITGMSEVEYANLVTDKLISCFEIGRAMGIYEDRIMRKVNAFVSGYPYIYDCGAPGDQLVVTPDGMVGVCQAYCGNRKNFVSMDDLVDISNHPLWAEWRYRSPLYQEQCYTCLSLGICGGGCPYNAELKTGSIWGIDESFCVHSVRTVKYLIKDLYRQSIS